MKKGILFLICYCCLTGSCLGQNKKIDSLLLVLKTAKEDTNKVKTLYTLAKAFYENNPDTVIYFANQALALAAILKDKLKIADAHILIGSALDDLGRFPEALKNYNDALKVYDELLSTITTASKSKILKGKANAYNNIGIIYRNKGNYPEGLKKFFAALKIYQEIGFKNGIVGSYNNIGVIYANQGNYPEALKNYLTSLKQSEELGNKQLQALNLNNIGTIYNKQGNNEEALKNYFVALKVCEELADKRGKAKVLANIGIIYDEKRNYPEALKNYFATLKLDEELGDIRDKAIDLTNIGNVYYQQGNYPGSLKYHLAVLKITEEIGDKEQMANGFNAISKDYVKMKKRSEASRYLNKGLSLAKEIGNLSIIRDNYDLLVTFDSAQDNFRKSLEDYKMYIIYRDSLANNENAKKTMQIQMQYEFDKKESLAKAGQEKKDAIALNELQKQKLLKYSFLGGIGLVLILFFFIYRTYRVRQMLRLYDIRNRIAGDLHDDIGSTLNSISIYSEVAKKKDEHHDEALEMIGDASRKVIDAMSDIVWTINAENDSFAKIIFRMKSLAWNLFRAKNIEFTFHADEILNEKKLSLEQRRNFYLIFKEAINNLVKYANATRAAITLTNENDFIRLRIQDDGVGFDTSAENAGNGLKNMKRRAQEMQAEFTIESQVGGGTMIELILKA